MKNFRNIVRGLMTLSVATLLVITAVNCSDDEKGPSARTWSMTVEAVMENGTEDGTRTDAIAEDIIHDFSTEDRIYVYNATKRSLLDGCLKPVEGGQPAATLIPDGSLKGIVEVGDELVLNYYPFDWYPDEQDISLKLKKYRHNPWYGSPPISSYCVGYYQTGERSKIMNFYCAESHVMVESTKGGVIQVSERTAKFTPLQSIFQLSFRFVDEEGNDIGVDVLDMKGEPIRTRFWDDNLQGIQDMISFCPSAMDENIYVALPTIFPLENFTRLIINIGGYEGSMDAPDGKFQNGKIYRPTEPIVMKKEAD